MNITGKINVKVYVKKDHDGKDFKTYVGSLAKKNGDDDYSYIDYDVKLTKDSGEPLETGIRYQLDVKEGFLSHRNWLDRDNVQHQVTELVITKYEVTKKAKIEKAE